jgi:hypothetical protein
MIELKPLSSPGIPAALEKAKQYRVLNEALEAESICLDVLEIEPGNQEAAITLILALTDQFDRKMNDKFSQAREMLTRLEDPYHQAYYDGIIAERRAKVALGQNAPSSGYVAHGWFVDAMELFEKAIELRPAGNDDPILRWNTCARIMNRNPAVKPAPLDSVPDMLE